MPTINGATTKSSNQVWASPDGQRVLHEVTFEYQGQQFKAKTYSKAITEAGWTGDIVLEERQGRNGAETFAKQVPREGNYGGPNSNSGGARPSYGGGSSGKPMADPFTMYLSYAKDLQVARITSGMVDAAELDTFAAEVLKTAYTLYNGRPDAPQKIESTPEPEVIGVQTETEKKEIADGLDAFFSDNKPSMDNTEKSWTPGN